MTADHISFHHDVPVPDHNQLAYRQLFVVEQWLRRIAYASLMAKVGSQVLGGLPNDLAGELKRRLGGLPNRYHLGVEMADEVIWMTTTEELRDLLTGDLFPMVRELTDFHKPMLLSKLEEIREIRNVVGHNRAVSAKTLTILTADILSLETGIGRFQHEVLRNRASELVPLRDEVGLGLETRLASELLRRHLPIPKDAFALAESRRFYFMFTIPPHLRSDVTKAERELGNWVDIQVAISRLQSVRQSMLALVLPVKGGGLTIVWPKVLEKSEHEAVLEWFIGSIAEIWCDEPYPAQDGRFVCHPKVWFTATA